MYMHFMLIKYFENMEQLINFRYGIIPWEYNSN